MQKIVPKGQAWAIIFVLFSIGFLMGSVTQLNLATQVYGLLPGTNGGTGISSTATYPASGTIMTTATGVAAGQLPNPTASTLGGIESITSLAHNWISYIDTSGVPHQSQPNYTDLAGTLPNPGASTLGGTESITCSAGSAITAISTSGVPTCTATVGATFTQAAPSGTPNGVLTTFTLSPTPAASANVNCFENGVQQQQGAGNDYTISGATITYLTAPPTGTKLNCIWY